MNRAKVGDSYTDTEYFIFATSPTGDTLVCTGKPAHYIRTLAGRGSLNFGPRYKGMSQSTVPRVCRCICYAN